MFPSPDLAIDHLKDVPGFKGLLKAVLKSQIQLLVEQLSVHTGEESIVLSASISDGALSYLSSGDAKDFMEERDDLKSQFLKHCLKKHHKKKEISPAPYENRVPPGPFITSSGCHAARGPIKQYDLGIPANLMPFMVSPPHLSSPPTKTENNHRMNRIEHPSLHMGENMTIANMNKQNNASNSITGINMNRRSGNSRKKHKPERKPIHNTSISAMQPLENTSISTIRTDIKSEPVSTEGNDLEMEMGEDLSHNSGVLSSSSTVVDGGGMSPGRQEASNLSVAAGDSSRDGVSGQESAAAAGMLGAQEMMMLGAVSRAGTGLDGLSSGPALHPVALHYAGNLFSSLKQSKAQQQELPKKRVYRKVECDICHRMIYITNIKVHKYRHLRHMENSADADLSADHSLNMSDVSSDQDTSAAEAAGIQTLVDQALSLVKREEDQT